MEFRNNLVTSGYLKNTQDPYRYQGSVPISVQTAKTHWSFSAQIEQIEVDKVNIKSLELIPQISKVNVSDFPVMQIYIDGVVVFQDNPASFVSTSPNAPANLVGLLHVATTIESTVGNFLALLSSKK